MGVFVILSKIPENPKLEAVIQGMFPNNYYELSTGQWLVSREGTAKTVADEIGITDKSKGLGSAIVLSVTGYWGVYSTDVWDWLKDKLESSVG